MHEATPIVGHPLELDQRIGDVLGKIRLLGKEDDTLVIFLSDNGANGLNMDQYPDTDKAWVDNNSDNFL